MNASIQRLPYAPSIEDRTDVESPVRLSHRDTSQPVVTGYVEKMMRVYRDHDQSDRAVGGPLARMETGHWVLDLEGRPSGAAAAVLADSSLAASVRKSVDALHRLVTTELHLNFLRPLPTDGTFLEAWADTLVGDNVGGMATCTLRDSEGTEYVHASGWFQGVEANTAEGRERYVKTGRQPLGADASAHLGVLLAAGPSNPNLPDVRPVVTGRFVPGLGFARKESLGNSHGAVHGGALVMMASLAAQQAMPDRSRYDLQSLRVAYLRPGSGAMASRIRVSYAGSSLRVVEVELFNADVGGTSKASVQATAIFRSARNSPVHS